MKTIRQIIPDTKCPPAAADFATFSVVDSVADASPLRSKFARTLLLAGLMLLAIEGGVRLRAYLRYGHGGAVAKLYACDPQLGNVPQAGARMVLSGATTTVNRWGLRGADCALVKPAGVLRILCLGESTTFGQPVDDDASVWPARMERFLRAEGVEAEVLNAPLQGLICARDTRVPGRCPGLL